MKIDKAIQTAYHYYQAGDLKKAADIFKKLLKSKPNNINILNMLQIIYCQLGEFDEAIRLLKKEINLTPSNAEVYYKLGTVFQVKGLFSEAVEYFRKAINLRPNFPDALYNLGLSLQNLGQTEEAISIYRKVIEIEPRLIEAYNNIGILLSSEGLFDEAIMYFQKGLKINPNYGAIYNNIGLALKNKGNFDEAIKYFEKAVSLNPNFVDAYYNLGLFYDSKKQFDEAVYYYKKTLQIEPNFIDALNSIGVMLAEKGQFDEAIIHLKSAIRINPNYSAAYYNLGKVLSNKGEFEEAVSYYQKAINISPDYTEAYYNLGNIFMNKGELEKAISHYQKAIDINPTFTDAYNNFGVALTRKGQLNEAEELFRKTLIIEPDRIITYSNLLFNMNYNPRYSPEDILKEHLIFSEKFEKPLIPFILPHSNERIRDKKLRIGYCSPDFRRHAVSYFFEPIMMSHNRDKFEVICYSNSNINDEITERIQGNSDEWRNIVGISDEEAASIIRNDKIDILIDLAGHTANNRILLFAHKPAPIQASCIGYFATTGLSAMDYKIVDNFTDPIGKTEQFYTEKLIRLPETFLCYLPDKDSPEISPLPVLSNGYITFGSLSNFSKITPEVFSLWARILNEIPDAHLILKDKCFIDEKTRQYAINMFNERGVSSERIELQTWDPSPTHLKSYHQIDIGLDTFPFNGATTTCEAMWMGVPVITLAGKAYHARAGVSLLSNVGLPHLIANTEEEYIKIAVELASDIEGLKILRESLRDMMLRSPLTDAKRFTENLEKCYRKMWEDWCNSN